MKVKDSNADDADHTRLNGKSPIPAGESGGPQPAVVGYVLNNYLVPIDAAIPETCEPPAEGQLPQCASNQIRAWTMEKLSRPLDGTSIHTGGKIDYQVTLTNVSGDTWKDMTVADDLTETLNAATWDKNSPVGT